MILSHNAKWEGLVDWRYIVSHSYTDTSVVSDLYTTAEKRSEEEGEGQICQESVQEITSTEDREDSIENYAYITIGTLFHCTYMSHFHPRSGHLSCEIF